ncbi:MAG: hypothetical protein ACYCVL_01675 [Gemmatimonadaceae bacterium]
MEFAGQRFNPGGAGVAAAGRGAGVPRWEWRAFERTFVAPQRGGAAAEAPDVVERDETHLLSLLSPHDVRICDGRLHIKRLERAGAGDLELWRPELTTEFPLAADALSAAFDAWAIPAPARDTPPHSLADLLRRLVVPHRDLRLVTLTKRSRPMTVAGCRGERAQITMGKHRWNTVAFEDADPMRVLSALEQLKLDPTANENCPRALKRILGLHDHSSSPSMENAC